MYNTVQYSPNQKNIYIYIKNSKFLFYHLSLTPFFFSLFGICLFGLFWRLERNSRAPQCKEKPTQRRSRLRFGASSSSSSSLHSRLLSSADKEERVRPGLGSGSFSVFLSREQVGYHQREIFFFGWGWRLLLPLCFGKGVCHLIIEPS